MGDPVDAIMAVMQDAFDHAYGEAWTRRQVSDALVTPNTHFMLGGETEDGSGPTAFTLSRSAADEEELLLIAVRPEYRGQGLGSDMMEQFFTSARARGVRRVFLEMREGNAAEHLYRKLGFKQVGLRKGYYRGAIGGPLDAITFARDLA
ncbi:ribosomal protein S18-alanine N-acetyltransferase [Aurantiacibacter sediminis]|uniref:[Ribosomal protein bS18]-alanine N-acetyltransferase n=1 Tax=Aurantiacibacter sediminis TaxID=2793064 RepID=A0ABS0N2G0_9SPHN|nr:ribosomal protein S18-alanine N-acetyltransferase [Aurantiacibacter sediminis]MBH5322144.1 ribosomal protein S18-alanine N-acetyltransferase [Aurantiacibacter sediminis]